MRLLAPRELIMMMNAYHFQQLFSCFRYRVKVNNKRRSLQKYSRLQEIGPCSWLHDLYLENYVENLDTIYTFHELRTFTMQYTVIQQRNCFFCFPLQHFMTALPTVLINSLSFVVWITVFSPWITGKKLYEEQNGFRHKQ